jgi:7,8-dihydroneopterin aldolase/epimerase/oxygenase
MSADWTLRIDKMPIELAVGIYPHELQSQPLLVSLEVEGTADAAPHDLEGCLDYEPLCLWLRLEWSQSPHVPLLETRVNQVFEFLFDSDPRITTVKVGLYKQRMSFGAQSVGIERRTSRADFEKQRRRTAEAQRPVNPEPVYLI